jgi:hypothetical protein
VEHLRKPIRPERVRSIPQSFSWIDREILHQGFLKRLSQGEILLYFFLALVAGPEGTSFWSYRSITKLLALTEGELLEAIRGLCRADLVAFNSPTFQVLSLPQAQKKKEIHYR